MIDMDYSVGMYCYKRGYNSTMRATSYSNCGLLYTLTFFRGADTVVKKRLAHATCID